MSAYFRDFSSRFRALWGESRYRTDIKQFVEFGAGYFVVLIIGYLLLRKINLVLTDVEMGKFSYVQSLVMIVAPVLYFAAPQAYLRFHEEHCISKRLRSFLMPLYWFAFAVLSMIIYWKTCSAWALAYALYPFFMEKTYFLRAQMEVRKLNVLRTIELLMPLAALYVMPLRTTAFADCILGLYGLGYAMSFLFAARNMGDSAIDRGDVVRYLAPLVFTSLLAVLLSNVAVVAVKHYWGYQAAGQMGVAVRSLLFMRSLSALFLMFFPMIYFREARKGNFGVVRLYRSVVVGTVVLFAAALAVFAPFVYRILGASAYLDSVNLFRVLVVAELANFMIDVYCLYFALEIKTWKGTIVKTVSLMVVIGGLGAIPWLTLAENRRLMYVAITVLFAAVVSAMFGGIWALVGERSYMKGGKWK